MNYLAHIYLTSQHNDLLLGNFIGDFVKGRELSSYPRNIANGIRLHRAIDNFTDKHEMVLECKHHLFKTQRHYASLVIDIYFDHFLAYNWTKFHSQPLEQFSLQFYKYIESRLIELPGRCIQMFDRMRKQNWLLNYANRKGIEKVFGGMSRRTPYQNNMTLAARELFDHYDFYQDYFTEFWQEIRKFCKTEIQRYTESR